MIYFKKELIKVDGIYQKETNIRTSKIIQDFYKTKPFPNFSTIDSKSTILEIGNKNIIAKNIKQFFKFNKKILEVGSGTSQLSNYLAIGTNNDVIAMDTTLDSLKIGKVFSEKNGIKNITYVKADLFEDIFKDNVFDLVWCSGVLHHTSDPYGGFKNILKFLKKDGYIIIGLYNKIFRIRTLVRKYLSKVFGKKILMKFDPHIKKLNYKLNEEKINAWINDQYYNPVESLHTFDEVLNWFKKNNIEYINSIPNIGKNYNDNLFIKVDSGDYVSRFLSQFSSIFSALGGEGGLFILVGKKTN